jgi:hypothetical protein
VRKLLGPVAAVALTLAMVGTVLAWAHPMLTAECAPDANSLAWKINLQGPEDNYSIDWSFDSAFVGATTVDFLTAGDHSFATPRGGWTLYVRWSSHHASQAQAAANLQTCTEGSHSQPESGQQSIEAGTGTSGGGSIPDASMGGIGSTSAPTILFSLLLLASLAALVVSNVNTAKDAGRVR